MLKHTIQKQVIEAFNGETVAMPKEVYAAIKTLLDEFLWADYPERMKYFQGEARAERNSIAERKEYQKAADQFEAAALIYEAWGAFKS